MADDSLLRTALNSHHRPSRR